MSYVEIISIYLPDLESWPISGHLIPSLSYATFFIPKFLTQLDKLLKTLVSEPVFSCVCVCVCYRKFQNNGTPIAKIMPADLTWMTPHIHEVIISIAPGQHTDGCYCDDLLPLSTRSECCHQVPHIYDTMKSALGSYHTIPQKYQRINQLWFTCVLNMFPWKLESQYWQTTRE
jgi:hypothetical protein